MRRPDLEAHQLETTTQRRYRQGPADLPRGAFSTVSHANRLEQQETCSGDAMRLCSSEIPNVDRITACMERQRDSLSDGCKAVFEADAPAAAVETPVDDVPAARPSRPINLVPKYKHG
jgi:hypothetical protein